MLLQQQLRWTMVTWLRYLGTNEERVLWTMVTCQRLVTLQPAIGAEVTDGQLQHNPGHPATPCKGA